MNRRNLLITVAIFVGVGVLAYGTWCCLDWMARRHVHADHGSLWTSETWPKLLGLNEEQRLKIQPLEKTLKKDMDHLQIELTQSQIALCRLMMSPGKPDSAALRQTLRRIGDLQKQREEKTLNQLLALRETLTPYQQKKLFTTMMRDICQGCRAATGSRKDYCGMCLIQ